MFFIPYELYVRISLYVFSLFLVFQGTLVTIFDLVDCDLMSALHMAACWNSLFSLESFLLASRFSTTVLNLESRKLLSCMCIGIDRPCRHSINSYRKTVTYTVTVTLQCCDLLHMYTSVICITHLMKSTKVQTLGRIWRKYWNIWIENTFSCICIIGEHTRNEFNVKSQGFIYKTSFHHNLH